MSTPDPNQAPTAQTPPEQPQASPQAPEETSSGLGRPSNYRPEYALFAKQLCEQGATDAEVAYILRIGRSTLYEWLARYPDFRDALRLGKQPANVRVERAFYERCVGYEVETEKVFQYLGQPVRATTTEHVPADPSAAFNWLCNRDPENWRNRRELTGAGGGPIDLKTTIEFVDADHEPGAVSE